MSAGAAVTERTAELSENLDRVLARIEAARADAGREPGSVRLLPVTKFFPASDIEILYRLGRREFGESREQEAAGKAADLSGLAGIEWHIIGRLQRNKANAVARYAHTVHSLDSERLATALDRGSLAALEAGLRAEPLRVLIQVSLDEDPARGGAAERELDMLAERVGDAEGLRLGGLMAIPPLGDDPDSAFARLATLHTRLLASHPAATELSAGMSGDLESAVRHGATLVRVGTGLMGARPITSA
ncbi:YggS family pyridoxal phosphate-dependent enzyme [Nocardia puris]|uniref:Pyridoxal phosphate homeostasis protein n=1 Tax=Nocardia puris TaxID=208602 RepID=A0A366DJA1_9NOCA|nr:YggS family pyridoxal phosphate-dependent enzyme [Nocardia puris]RBO90153.1 hypothetical protein DFR74_10637 [Nocardia puris]